MEDCRVVTAHNNFKSGDRMLGVYGGNEWTRDMTGRWYFTGDPGTLSTHGWLSDGDVETLLNLKVKYPPKSEPTGPQKLSKSEKSNAPVYQYNYTFKPA